jgi:hypothetical protein|tara:strand:- start:3666 stop:3863 length:198 start_codon:yes stop_codon:yes gene_type:complete
MLKKIRNWMIWIFTKDTNQHEHRDDIHYFDAKHFFNDLDNQEDYYLKITPGKEHEFVRKDEVTRP